MVLVVKNVEHDIRELGAYSSRKILEHRYILVHRNTVARSLLGAAEFFKKPPYGWSCPYHALVTRSGEIERGLDYNTRGVGAMAANPYSIQVAVDWDLHLSEMPELMYNSLVEYLRLLQITIPNMAIQGHMEFDKARRSTDIKKDCPGKFLDMNKLRADVEGLKDAIAT